MLIPIPLLLLLCETLSTFFLLRGLGEKKQTIISINSIIKLAFVTYIVYSKSNQLIKYIGATIRVFGNPVHTNRATIILIYAVMTISGIVTVICSGYAILYFTLSLFKDGEYEDFFMVSNRIIRKDSISRLIEKKNFLIIEYEEYGKREKLVCLWHRSKKQ